MANAAASQDDSLLAQVSSLYGPGNVGGWLCVVGAVLVTWIFNTKYKSKDSITVDFVAAAAMPVVAAGHFYYLLAKGVNGVSARDEASVPRADFVQLIAAMQAPFRISREFQNISFALFAMAVRRGHIKRTSALVLVWLVTLPLDVMAHVGPFEALDKLGEVSIVGYILDALRQIAVRSAGLVHCRIVAIEQRKLARDRQAAREAGGWPEYSMGSWPRRGVEAVVFYGLAHLVGYAIWIAVYSVHYWSIPDNDWDAPSLSGTNYAPRSNNKLSELDQAVSLAVGVVTLTFSAWDAFHPGWKAWQETGQELRDAPLPLTQGA
jgi:hypothetical protein